MAMLMGLVEAHLKGLEKKGLLPKGRGETLTLVLMSVDKLPKGNR